MAAQMHTISWEFLFLALLSIGFLITVKPGQSFTTAGLQNCQHRILKTVPLSGSMPFLATLFPSRTCQSNETEPLTPVSPHSNTWRLTFWSPGLVLAGWPLGSLLGCLLSHPGFISGLDQQTRLDQGHPATHEATGGQEGYGSRGQSPAPALIACKTQPELQAGETNRRDAHHRRVLRGVPRRS